MNFASSKVFLHLGAAFGQKELRVFLEEGRTDKDNTDKLKRDNVEDDVTGELFLISWGWRPRTAMINLLMIKLIMNKHSDVYSRRGVSLIMLLCPVVINRPVGGVISVGSHSYANYTAE